MLLWEGGMGDLSAVTPSLLDGPGCCCCQRYHWGEADLPRVSLGAKSHCLGHASWSKAFPQANTQHASPEQTAEQVALHIPWECWENPADPSQPLYTGSPYNNSRELGCATTQGDDGSERLRTSPRTCSCQMTPRDPTSRPKWFEIEGSRGEMTGCASTCCSGPVPSHEITS